MPAPQARKESDKFRIRLALLATIVLLVVLFQLPGDTMLWQEIQNTGHTVAFVLIAILLMQLVVQYAEDCEKDWNVYLVVLVLGIFIAAITELVQWFINSDVSFSDIARDIAGLVGAVLIRYGLAKEHAKVSARKSGVLAGAFILVASMYPLVSLGYLYIERNRAFPVLLEADGRWSNRFITVENSTLDIRRIEGNTENGFEGNTYRVKTGVSAYPGFGIREVVPNWSGFKRIVIEIYSEHKSPVDLVIRINDRAHNQEFDDRYNRNISVEKGCNRYQIVLESIYQAPVNRRMDERKMHKIMLFVDRPETTKEFYISNVRLER